MNEATRNALRGVGMSDEEIARLSPGILKYLANRHKLNTYKIIAEVFDSRCCLRGLKPGARYVFRYAELLPELCTGKICASAMPAISDRINMILNQVGQGVDPEEALVFPTAECFDVGLEHGGVGKVWFKVYVEKDST